MKTSVVVFILSFNFVSAQTLQKVNAKIIGLNDGLSSLNIRKIIEDKNGFFWLSTQDGLNKYDGKNILKFTIDNASSKRKILGADCYNMVYNKGENYLYILNGFEGLNKIDVDKNEVITKISFDDIQLGKTKEWLKRMIRYKNYLIIATPKKIIFFNAVLLKTEAVIPLVEDKIRDISFIEKSNDILYATLSNGELLTFDLVSRRIVESSEVFSDCDLNSLVCNGNYLFASTSKGVKIFDIVKKKIVDPKNYFQKNYDLFINVFTQNIYFEKNVQYISNANGLYSFNLDSKNAISYIPNGNSISEIAFKNANSILFANNQLFIGGAIGVSIFKISASPFSSIKKDANSNKLLGHIFNLKPINSNKQLVCAEDGVYICDSKHERLEKIYENDIVLSAISLRENEHIFSGEKGLFFYNNGVAKKASEVYTELKIIQNDWLICAEKVNESKYIFVSQNGTGIYIWDKLNKSIKQINKISTPKVNDLLINRVLKLDNDKFLIISETEINELTISSNFIKEVFKKNDSKFLVPGVLMDACKQGDNFYAGAYGLGLIKFDKNFQFQKLITSKEGINNLGIYKVFSFNDSLIALTTNNGLSIYNTKSDKVQNYFEADGLHSNAFEETSGFQQGDTIFAGGIKGYTIFDTKKYATNTVAPKLYFDDCTVNTKTTTIDTTNLFLTNLTIPNNYTKAKISFVGLNYQNPTRVNYWYRITEFGNDWIDLKNQNFIDLIGISPGKYHLEVKAANEDGVECKPIAMELHFLPKWYQTLLFKILVALLIAGLLYALYSFRIRQLKKVLAVRQKISQNLHDDIGSTLSAINMYTQVAKLQPQQNTFMDSIEENTKEVLEKLDDIIWSTNPKNDKIQNLVERMEGFAIPLCTLKNVKFELQHNHKNFENKIPESVRQNLFIIFKEAINNALKYSGCSLITVSLIEKNNTIQCSVIDNGKGFDTSIDTERNGLLNMQQRAKELKGNCILSSTINIGTEVKISLPL